jgi:hypothetical protein
VGSIEAKLSSVDSDLWHAERWLSMGSLVTDGHDRTDLSFKVSHGNSFIGKELILVSYILLKQLFKMFLLTQLQSTIKKYTGNIASLLIARRRLKLLFF